MESSPVRHWYIAYTKSCQERKSAEILGRLGFESYVPVQKEPHKWSDRIKIVDHILIRGLVFVRCTNAERKEVLDEVPYVYAFMMDRATRDKDGNSRPAVIQDREMDRFKFMVGHAKGEVRISTETFEPGDQVRIKEGPLAGMECEIVKVDGHKTAIVRLGTLGSALVTLFQDTLRKL